MPVRRILDVVLPLLCPAAFLNNPPLPVAVSPAAPAPRDDALPPIPNTLKILPGSLNKNLPNLNNLVPHLINFSPRRPANKYGIVFPINVKILPNRSRFFSSFNHSNATLVTIPVSTSPKNSFILSKMPLIGAAILLTVPPIAPRQFF